MGKNDSAEFARHKLRFAESPMLHRGAAGTKGRWEAFAYHLGCLDDGFSSC